MAPSLSFPSSISELRVPQEEEAFARTSPHNSPRMPLVGSLSRWEMSSLKCDISDLALVDPLQRSPGSAERSQLSFQSSCHNSGSSSQHLCSSGNSLGNAMMNGEWQQMLHSTTMGYASAMTSLLSSSSKSTNKNPNTIADLHADNPSTREPIVSFGGISLRDEVSFSRLSPILSRNQHQVGLGLEKVQIMGSGWNSLEPSSNSGITINPSHGRVALQAVSQTSMNDLQQRACDSVFGETNLKLPSYCNEDTNHLTPAFSLKREEKSMLGFKQALAEIQPGSSKLLISSGCTTPQSPVPSNLAMCVPVPEQSAVICGTKPLDCLEQFGESKVMDDGKSVKKAGSSTPLEQNRAGLVYTVNYESDETGSNPRNEDSSGSDQANGGNGVTGTAKKRNLHKAKLLGMSCDTTSLKAKDTKVTMDEPALKRQKGVENTAKEKEENKSIVERSESENSGNSAPGLVKENLKPPEPPKADFIHVRARRGQATDSHSLAERVRREKISERMKFLQDLVPGCNKVTGKAVMLDEIINYVQSLQHQVQFLSMKLAAVNSRLEFNLDGLVNKKEPLLQNLAAETQPACNHAQIHQQKETLLQARIRGVSNFGSLSSVPVASSRGVISILSPPSELYGDVVSQKKNTWDGDLQSIVQMGFIPNRQYPLELQELQSQVPARQLRAEMYT
ncbi:hypothetical protein O6H91_18G023100 [Diphasiastrum complanatum]|uniref:Uncharacterized protein n=2 Tax=Diphasiastrum complanatum TaxID=34168 RepID=A0ACC2AYV0_DIPCM|nr:hypothetical protein O6H91_18G023100 [Diphasiastrum complanatum]KAJ7522694.1 hypothetical protein O6H91_18G023100 [Diphasiastrum complanatum]